MGLISSRSTLVNEDRIMDKMMRCRSLYIGLSLLLTACSASDFDGGSTPETSTDEVVGQTVSFTVNEAVSRATSTIAMDNDGRFVCSMYYHSKNGDTNDSAYDMAASSTAWLKINASGTPVYWNKDYTTKNVTTNEDGDDTSAGKFYWQNRLSHVFLALADYNQLTTNTYNSGAQGALKMYPDGDNKDDKTLMVNGNTLANDSSINVYDLTRGDKTSMAEQPDPIVALTAQVPANYISNTVALTFKHQFAQVQVNVFNDRSADQSVSLTSELITKVELIDVSTEGYVYNRINEDGTVNATVSNTITPNEDDTPVTAFEMFSMSTPASGAVKSYQAIAFGSLRKIRITWKESTDDDAIEHVTTYTLDTGKNTLASGKKYTYNIYLIRSSLVSLKPTITDWTLDKTYSSEATISDDTED